MLEEKLARLRTHRNNIGRYRRLLRTKLTDLERDFVLKRIKEEEQALQALAESDVHLIAARRIEPLQAGGSVHV